MSGNIAHFFGSVSRFFSRPQTPLYSAEGLERASEKLAKHTCPHCDCFASFDCEVTNETDTSTCRHCGAKWVFNNDGKLIAFHGHDKNIYANYQYWLDEDDRRRQACINLEAMQRRHAA